jgi:hypothetical protein
MNYIVQLYSVYVECIGPEFKGLIPSMAKKQRTVKQKSQKSVKEVKPRVSYGSHTFACYY